MSSKSNDRIKAAFSQGAEDSVNVWQTVYGDMMTNLMLFFLMMFSLNMVGKEHVDKAAQYFKKDVTGRTKFVPDASATPVEPTKAKDINEFFQKFSEKEKNLQCVEGGEGIRLRLPEPVLFDVGEAELKPEAERLLHEFADGLKHLPNTVVVEGHTDNVPISRGPYKSNWELSEARAEIVVNHLAKEGIPYERLAVAAFGEFWPFVSNDSDLNRALNRRIELFVIADEKR